MRIQNNIPAYNANRNYGLANSAIASSSEKLSSGYRINRAGDDAAGLAISEKMRAQIRGLEMASKNTLDAVSMVQTAEGALQKSHDILQRMRELAVQSGSDTNETIIDRGALDQEFQALKAEIDDIARVTRFNDQNLLDGTYQAHKSFLSATDVAGVNDGKMSITVDPAKAGLYTVTVASVTANVNTVTAGTLSEADATGTFVATGLGGIAADSATFSGVASSAFNNNTYTVTLDEGSTLDRANFSVKDSNGKTIATLQNVNINDWKGVDSAGGNDDKAITLNFAGFGTVGLTITGGDSVRDIGTVESYFADFALTFGEEGKGSTVVSASVSAIRLTINGESVDVIQGDTYANFAKTGITINFYDAVTDLDVASTGDFEGLIGNGETISVGDIARAPMIIQSGANQGDETRINIDSMTARSLGIAHSDIATQKSAANAITEVNNALNKVSTQRAALGAIQNRLTYKQENLDISAENLTAAESRIRDVDMAKEMTVFSKKNIVAQAATAMLAQANTLPQNVLQLLR